MIKAPLFPAFRSYLMPWLLFFIIWIHGTLALAHATFVLVDVTLDPVTPEPHTPLNLTLIMSGPTGAPIEDAVVFVDACLQIGEFFQTLDNRTCPESSAKPIRVRFIETQTGGTYQAALTLPQSGSWDLFFRDQTFKREEATANIVITAGAENPRVLSFIFPPTAIDDQNVTIWLIWLVGLPLIAGTVVTIMVLTSSDKSKDPPPSSSAA